MEIASRYRLGFWRALFYLLLGAGLVALFVRLTEGLGAVSNLTDRYPWGLWVGFKLSGIMLAGGGFVITAVVYIFNIERYRPVARMAVVTAFLGYLAFVMALLCDLGRPWTIWHPIVMWNPHSVMFEVAWCVTLYTTVLALEFSSMLFERLRWQRAVRIQHAVTIPLVVAGVVLSTLHQSSLGSLYLIVPGKLHALWYTPMLPILFFVSAITVGLAMVNVVSHLSARVHGKQLDPQLRLSISRIMTGFLILYGVLRFGDLWVRGALPEIASLTYESSLFLVEVGLGLLLPLALLSSRAMRTDLRRLYAICLLVVLGFITQRMNVAITGFEGAQGGHYIPALSESLITLMFLALGFAGFHLAVRHFNVYPPDAEETAQRGVSAAEDARSSAALPAVPYMRPDS
jgi:Ni/Fe-hydrogenase subunit HybB-like protein